jgi:replicative superfamily II helicase
MQIIKEQANCLRQLINVDRQQDLIDAFRTKTTTIDGILEKTLLYGVAFHHAGWLV